MVEMDNQDSYENPENQDYCLILEVLICVNLGNVEMQILEVAQCNWQADSCPLTGHHSIQNDSIRNDSIQNYSIQNDSVQNDSIQNDSIQNDSIQNDSIQNYSIQND